MFFNEIGMIYLVYLLEMDIQQSLINGGVSGSIVAILYFTYKIFKKSKCTSRCCGYRNEMEVTLGSNNSNSSRNLDKPFIA